MRTKIPPFVQRNPKEKANYLRRIAELAANQNRSILAVASYVPDIFACIREFYPKEVWLAHDCTVDEQVLFALFVAEFWESEE